MSGADPATTRPVRRPAPSPAASDHVRLLNTALVLRTLRDLGPTSRADLAKSTGLAKATVGTIIANLRAVGAVQEQAATAAPRGRPGRPMALDGAHLVGLGIEVNVDYMAAVALDLSGRTVLVEERPSRTVDDNTDLAAVRGFVSDCHTTLSGAGHRVLGLTVAVPGLVEREAGRVRSAPNLGWTDLDLTAELSRTVDPRCRIRVDNDANCAALAEVSRGVAAGMSHVLYLTGTVGLGGGIVVDGQIMRGGNGYAGEVGHMLVGRSDVRCACGRSGCWEALVGLRAMLDAVGLSGKRAEGADPVDVAEQVAALAQRDPTIGAGLGRVAEHLAAGCSILANALNPQMIVLGGYFEPLGPWLLPTIVRVLDRDVFAEGSCTIALSTLGVHAASTGAATEILDDIYAARRQLIAIG